MAEPTRRTDLEPCRCPEGWPMPMASFDDGSPVVVLRHHLGECGLPEEIETEEEEA